MFDVQVGVGRLPVDRCGEVSVDQDIQEREGAVWLRVFDGVLEVLTERVDVTLEGLCMLGVSGCSNTIIHKMTV